MIRRFRRTVKVTTSLAVCRRDWGYSPDMSSVALELHKSELHSPSRVHNLPPWLRRSGGLILCGGMRRDRSGAGQCSEGKGKESQDFVPRVKTSRPESLIGDLACLYSVAPPGDFAQRAMRMVEGGTI